MTGWFMNNLKNILHKYRIPYDDKELLQVFTHNSFSEKNHSRSVFLGMYAFKGSVCGYIYENIAGTGTQLQHFLGNIFKQKFLDNFFVKYKLQEHCRFKEINIEQQRHIFVYALLGYIYENTDAGHLEDFIREEFIIPNDAILPSNHRPKNRWEQLIFLCKQHFDQKPKIITETDEEKIVSIRVILGEKEIASTQSVSYKYARKKSINTALKYVAGVLEEKLNNDAVYQKNEELRKEREQQKMLEAKAEKQRKHILRNQSHSERMKLKNDRKKIEAQEKERKRRQQKAAAKEKSAKKIRTVYREYTKEEIAAMSNAKRRNLQDRGIIPKGL